MVCTCFYDENDNFNDKRFILTSYNKAVKIEDKIRKSSTIFDGPNSSNNMDSARHNPLKAPALFHSLKILLVH